MRDSHIYTLLQNQESKIIACRRQIVETTLDLGILKELLFEKGTLTKEEYAKRIEQKTQEFMSQFKQAEPVEQKSEEVVEIPNEPTAQPEPAV